MKMIISDTTALIILAKSNHLNLLTNIIDRVYVPKAVMRESEPHSPKSKIMEEASFVMNTREEKQNLAELSNLS